MKPAVVWIGLVLLIFAVGLSSVGLLVVRATRDKTFGVEPDYYQKAVRWDDAARQRAANERLGWTASAGPGAEPGTIAVRIVDRAGAPVEGALVTCEAFAHARSRSRTDADAADAGAGAYTLALRDPRPGLWRVRVRATRGEDVFTADLDAQLPAEPAP